jgi:hypothetical protein
VVYRNWVSDKVFPSGGLDSMNQVSEPQFARFAARADLPGDASLRQVVEAVQAIPYGRPGSRTADGVISEWKGTCSTKHALLAQLLSERWPDLRPRLVHRVYRVSRGSVLQRHGAEAAGAVPAGGLTDVHRYLVITLVGREVRIDITFPADPAWDGHRSMAWRAGTAETSRPEMIQTPIRPGSKPATVIRSSASPSSPPSRSHHGRRAMHPSRSSQP